MSKKRPKRKMKAIIKDGNEVIQVHDVMTEEKLIIIYLKQDTMMMNTII